MRNVEGRPVVQALAIFLFNLSTGNSDEVISAVFGQANPQHVSEITSSVLNSFEKDVPPASSVEAFQRDQVPLLHRLLPEFTWRRGNQATLL